MSSRLKSISLLILFCACIVNAAPSITSVSGNLSNNQIIEIEGFGFGTKTQAAPLISSYDNGQNSFSGMTIGQNPGGDWDSSSGAIIHISATDPLRSNITQSSRKVSYFNYYDGHYNALRYDLPPNTSNAYLSWWHYRDDTDWHISDGYGNNNKFIRYYWGMSDPEGSPVITIVDGGVGDGIPDQVSFQASDGCRALPYSPDSWTLDYAGGDVTKISYQYAAIGSGSTFLPHLQQWDHHELYVTFSSSAGSTDSSSSYWMNGREMFRAHGYPDSDYGQTTDGRRIFVIGHVSGGMDPGSNEYLDQVYIDNTQKHVFISNSSSVTWRDQEEFQHSEVQVASIWNDTSIDITLNQGSFNEGDTVYIYVVDETGNVSNGFPITLGEVPSACGAVDTSGNDIIESTELKDYINQWKHGDVTITNLFVAISRRKNGC